MVTLRVTLNVAGQELALGLPRNEWLKLVSDFVRMPADERQRMGVSIREATAASPFPADGEPLTPRLQRKCDTFVNDCILLAALAESTTSRLLLDTAVESYKLVPGLPQIPAAAKGAFN
ncbi:MAG: hypothetical protein DI585_00985 [Pseudomonas fluorescens]|nr:MAG: hypothetical protein DI585_00985 [Pseudomonas fluorescens]